MSLEVEGYWRSIKQCSSQEYSLMKSLYLIETFIFNRHNFSGLQVAVQICLLICSTVWVDPNVHGCNWATLFLGDINTGTWPSKLGESQMRQ
jgi:hypothetical protein